jgi:hypothetical protein
MIPSKIGRPFPFPSFDLVSPSATLRGFEMKAFTDSAGRAWEIALNIGTVKRLRDSQLHVDLLSLQEGDPPLLTRLATDVYLLCDVLFVLIEPQAEAAGVTDEEFGAALGGDVILAASTAFWEELELFFRGLGRTELGTAVAVQKATIQAAVDLGTKRLLAISPEGIAEAILNEQTPEINQSPCGKPSTSLPGSSA